MFWLFFFFSSRRRHTRWTGDWSSDVCSSDLSAVNYIGVKQGSGLQTALTIAKVAAVVVVIAAAFLVGPQVAVSSPMLAAKIGRASCRERVWISVGDGLLNKREGESVIVTRSE